jgi:hypothetical protein
MSKHTPGPWKVQELHADGVIITRGGRYEISTPTYDVCANLQGSAPIRKLEDARLIAAAPELYEQLSILVAMCAGKLPEFDLAAARAALAKAGDV